MSCMSVVCPSASVLRVDFALDVADDSMKTELVRNSKIILGTSSPGANAARVQLSRSDLSRSSRRSGILLYFGESFALVGRDEQRKTRGRELGRGNSVFSYRDYRVVVGVVVAVLDKHTFGVKFVRETSFGMRCRTGSPRGCCRRRYYHHHRHRHRHRRRRSC